MKFTFNEWKNIQHALEVAKRVYEKEMNDSKLSDEHTSCYQIFKRQAEEMTIFIDRISNAEL